MIAEGYGRDNPYLAGVVELDEGVKISAQILGADARKRWQFYSQMAAMHYDEGKE